MKRISFALSAACAIASGSAFADSCWIVTNLQGKTAFATEGYRVTDDGFANTVFVVRIKQTPTIQVAGPPASYGPGAMLKLSEYMVAYVDPHSSSTAEVWSFDPEKGVAYVTMSRAGFGIMNKAAMFVGKATPGC